MPNEILFERYLLSLRKTPLDEKTEHTDRLALEVLLRGLADEAGLGISIQHEPKRVEEKGAPDFKVAKGGLILGYVENKAIPANLDNVLRSEQITRYKSLSENILLTNYLHFIWLSQSGLQRETLCHVTDLENPRFRLQADRVLAVSKLISAFLSTAPSGIGRAQELALALATRSQLLRDYLGEELIRQERNHTEARLYGLFEVFRSQVFHEITLKDFADAFAQMLAYGLFLARLNSNLQPITLHNAREFVPRSFQLIRELVDFLTELQRDEYRDVRWVVEEVLSIVNGLDLLAIHEDLSFRNRSAGNRRVRAKSEEEWRLFSRDPFVYFYEDYLAKYDKNLKKARGVYYTPPPVVNFIVRAIDDLLKDTFAISSGLADHNRVTVLDFACGTGTFLVEVLERIFDNVGQGSAKNDLIIREHVLKNIFGFEYLIAPYTIAHLKLSQYLRDKNYNLTDTERFLVYLTNTLEPIDPQANLLLPALTAESREAQAVKDRNILVITGNPPYAGHSKNPSERIVDETVREIRRNNKVIKLKNPRAVQRRVKTAIGKLIEDYKFVDGEPLGEQNPKWLQDDYVKFIRFAQRKMEDVEEGVVGIITNHSYLDNPTFRGMRQSLTSTFNQIYVIDLHGSTKPKEVAPTGVANENVFDIQKGVAIALFVKKPSAPKGVWYSEFWGTRLQKYQIAAETAIRSIDWQEVACSAPYYMFRPLDWRDWDVYKAGWSIADSLSPDGKRREIFNIRVLGFQTHRDDFAIATRRSDIEERVSDMIDGDLSDAGIVSKYFLKNNRDWKIGNARVALRTNHDREKSIIRCAYRPFDIQHCFFGHEFMDYPRRELLDHVASRDNVELLVARQVGVSGWRHAFVSDVVTESCCISDGTTEQNYVFPLYVYPLETRGRERKADLFAETDLLAGKERIENLTPKFREWLDGRYGRSFTPEEILGYIYAILHSPTYRMRYLGFLRIDFPRVPFPERATDFEIIARMGWKLLETHLLREVPSLGYGKYLGKGDHLIDRPSYLVKEQAIYINDAQHFAPVPIEVWNFHIGGYQVIDKYLRSRRGQKLTLDEIDNLEKVANVLAFTIDQMEKIDAAYLIAFRD